jgi:hypothetical protein
VRRANSKAAPEAGNTDMHSSIELIDIDLMQLWLFEIQKAQPRSDQVTEHFGDNASGKQAQNQ